MEHSDVAELIQKSRSDGAQLYSVADALHKFSVFLIGLIAIIGLISGFAAMTSAGFLAGIIVFAGSAVLCMLLYAVDIVITNSSKVLVHILFSNIAMIERGKE